MLSNGGVANVRDSTTKKGRDRTEKFGSGVPGAKVVVFEQCGHVPQVRNLRNFNRALQGVSGKVRAIGCRQRTRGIASLSCSQLVVRSAS
jgi:hypothetical protein